MKKFLLLATVCGCLATPAVYADDDDSCTIHNYKHCTAEDPASDVIVLKGKHAHPASNVDAYKPNPKLDVTPNDVQQKDVQTDGKDDDDLDVDVDI